MTTILLVEDSKLLSISNERMLLKAGYDVLTVGDGEAALQLARQLLPDLILLDMMLPKVPGLEVLKTLRREALTEQIPVIVLTSLSSNNAGKLLRDGAAAYFPKSDLLLAKGSDELLQVIETVLAAGVLNPE